MERITRDLNRRIFASFDAHNESWRYILSVASRLDALMSIASVSSMMSIGSDNVSGLPVTRPKFVRHDFSRNGSGATLKLVGARHPCLEKTFSGNGFIPNDTLLGCHDIAAHPSTTRPSANIMLLTGANMGGKSTYLRTSALCCILAQLGCLVPCDEAVLSPVDRIFTRIGASDRILEGQSTFFVELSETSTILNHATARSLVILDELGRGTSTFDGVSIAHAVVQKLATGICCRTMFATHYHTLTCNFSAHARVSLANMACKVSEGRKGRSADCHVSLQACRWRIVPQLWS